MSSSQRKKAVCPQSLVETLDRRVLLSVAATVAAQEIVANGGTSDEFGVIFTSNQNVDPTTIQPGDITISGPLGTITPTLVKVNPATTPSTSVAATYKFTPPGGKWEMADNGTYTVDVAASTIKDAQGNPLAAGSIGSFPVDIEPSVVLNDGTLLINGTAGADTITVTRPDINMDVTVNGVTQQYDGDTVNNISVAGGTGSMDVILSVSVPATVMGTPGADTIFGGTGPDSIVGLGGNDCIVGGGGDDILEGAAGNDTILGGGGNDSIRGGKGDDLLRGGAQNDTIVGGPGNNSIGGGMGDDLIFAINSTADTITGGVGSDTVHADAGIDDVIMATTILNT